MRFFPKFIYKFSIFSYGFFIGFFIYIIISKNKIIKKLLLIMYIGISILLIFTGFRGIGFKDLFSLFIIFVILKKKKPSFKTLSISGIFYSFFSDNIFNEK